MYNIHIKIPSNEAAALFEWLDEMTPGWDFQSKTGFGREQLVAIATHLRGNRYPYRIDLALRTAQDAVLFKLTWAEYITI